MGSYPLVPRGLTVRDGLAYVSQEFDGVKIYNVSNPAAISLVGSYKAANSFTHGPVALAGNYAYVSDNRGLRILNIANPADPTEVSFTPTHDEDQLARAETGQPGVCIRRLLRLFGV